MTLGARHFFQTHRFEPLAARQSVYGAAALAVTAASFAWLLCTAFGSPHIPQPVSVQSPTPPGVNTYISFLDSRFQFYFSPGTFSGRSSGRSSDHQPAPTSLELTELIRPDIPPLESARPVQHPVSTPRSLVRRAPQYTAPGGSTKSDEALASSPDDKTTILEKLFAKLFRKPPSSSVQLAYAATDDGTLGDAASNVTGRYDQGTAVYDISAHRVYMPDGTNLEAHSGLGASLDDPTEVDAKDRGPTPPNIYNLELRATPFHGVRALRLIPVDEQKTLGRTGLLAHSFMLGPHGESNGCVSFRDYDAFLRAYLSQQVKRLVVVARLD
jgi:hypothetical protein